MDGYDPDKKHQSSSKRDVGNSLSEKRTKANIAVIQNDLSLLASIVSKQFWLIFFAFGLSGGAGLVLINNITQVCICEQNEDVSKPNRTVDQM